MAQEIRRSQRLAIKGVHLGLRTTWLGAALLTAMTLVAGPAGAGTPLANVVKVAAGSRHTCALTATGGVKCWGYNNSGQLGDNSNADRRTPTDVTGLGSGVVAIAAGSGHTCALTTTGGVKCWGENGSGQLGDNSMTDRRAPVNVAGLANGVVAIAAGSSHTCALTTGAGVKCWGGNAEGQLGDETLVNRLEPVDVAGLEGGVGEISTGGTHTCALTVAGGVKCWGLNHDGQLGDGTPTTRLAPVEVAGLASGVGSIAAGDKHTCALATAGGVRCWGYNEHGQVGDNTTTSRSTPVDVMGLAAGVVAIVADGNHTCALTTVGSMRCWGSNAAGQLGDDTTTDRPAPVDVMGQPSGVTAIAAGGAHSCAIATAGVVQCWGANSRGELGDGSTALRLSPVNVEGLSSGLVAIAASDYHSCALTAAGTVKCWGSNLGGQLGDGSMMARLAPVDVAGSAGIIAISARGTFTCALTAAGGVKCWGNNYYGQLGDGTNTNRSAPGDVTGLSGGVAAITAGNVHACARTSTGAVKCWGWNMFGQLGDGTNIDRSAPVDVTGLQAGVVAISAGLRHTCALIVTGGVKCWGSNAFGQLGDGSFVPRTAPVDVTGLSSGVIAIAAGGSHTCALTSSGGVKCWGSGRLVGDGFNTTRLTPVDVAGLASGVAAVSVGDSHACAITSARSVRCWGDNRSGQLGDGTTTTRAAPVRMTGFVGEAAAISAGASHTCALTSTGGAWCWGSNMHGVIGDRAAWYRPFPADVVVRQTVPPARGDASGDGKAELFWGQVGPSAAGLSWWTMNGGVITAANFIAIGGEWQVADVGDLDGDGRADLVWRRAADGATYLWMLDGLGIKGYANLGIVDRAAWTLVGVADFDGDGRDDIAWRGADGTVYLWLMDGGTIVAQGSPGALGPEWAIADLADFNSDGRADILWHRTTDGLVHAWFMNGISLLGQRSASVVDPAFWTLIGAADFDGDGHADILLRHPAGTAYLWTMDTFSPRSFSAIASMHSSWNVHSVGDFDNDGKADILWRQVGGPLELWRIEGSARKSVEPIANPGGSWQVVGP